MKSYADVEYGILEAGERFKRGFTSLLNNSGRAVALITAVITAIATFTDVGFVGLASKEFIPSLILLLTSAYIIYFSLEDAGEKLGERSEEYKAREIKYKSAADKIGGEDIDAMRPFLEKYAEGELEYRRRAAMLSRGISPQDLKSYSDGSLKDKKRRAAARAVLRIKPHTLTPAMLLTGERGSIKDELKSPEKSRILRLIAKLIPTTVCMTVTVSVILTTKEGMSLADVINALLKLSSLPVIGFRGYSAGYGYVKNELSAWLATKTSIIEAFIKERDGI